MEKSRLPVGANISFVSYQVMNIIGVHCCVVTLGASEVLGVRYEAIHGRSSDLSFDAFSGGSTFI